MTDNQDDLLFARTLDDNWHRVQLAEPNVPGVWKPHCTGKPENASDPRMGARVLAVGTRG